MFLLQVVWGQQTERNTSRVMREESTGSDVQLAVHLFTCKEMVIEQVIVSAYSIISFNLCYSQL